MKFEQNIGKKVIKKRLKKSGESRSSRPFKSGFKANTIKGVVEHPELGTPAYIFEEDDSYVDCESCYLVDELEKGVVEINDFQLKAIKRALELSSSMHDIGEDTSLGRKIRQSIKYIDNAVKGNKDTFVSLD